MGNQAEHKAEELKGKAKEAVGDATDNPDLTAEGKVDQAKGAAEQAGKKAKDAVKHITDR